ncbi:MAG: RIP metalloprotease RseP [Bauldia sp.]
MGLYEWFGGFGSTIVGYLVPFLFVLTVVVFVHELGHFLVARLFGVAVKVFSIGFGPEIFALVDRRGTRWRLSVIPLGGYVKFLGDENEVSATDRAALARMGPAERSLAFAGKPVTARAAIVAAGPLANFLLAIAIFTAIFSLYGREVMTPRVDTVVAGSAAERAGFEPGDTIVSIDGRPIGSFNDLQRVVSFSAERDLDIIVRRGDREITLSAAPERQDVTDRFGNQHRVGVLGIARDARGGDIVTERFSVPEAAWVATQETWFVAERTLAYLAAVVIGRESADQLGGPLRVAEVSAQVATLGFVALVNLAAILSISIGLINLFPIPMLDGGHLLFFAIEAVRGRPLSERVQEIGLRIGFATVVMLMVFATWNDIIHLSSL